MQGASYLSDRTQKWGRLFKWVKIKHCFLALFFYFGNLMKLIHNEKVRSFCFKTFFIPLQKQLHIYHQNIQCSFSKEITLPFTDQIRHVFTVLTPPAPFECILAIHPYIWILTLLCIHFSHLQNMLLLSQKINTH